MKGCFLSLGIVRLQEQSLFNEIEDFNVFK